MSLSKREELYLEVQRMILRSRDSYIKQRQRLGLPLFEIQSKSPLMDQVVSFVSLAENRNVEKFLPVYYTEEEAAAVMAVSTYVAVICATYESRGSIVPLEVSEYLEEHVLGVVD